VSEEPTVSGASHNTEVPWIPPAEAEADGFVGIGGTLAPAVLLRAYSEGVFPWYNEGEPILWWSPDPRGVIGLSAERAGADGTPGYGGLHVSKRLARTIRGGKFRVTLDTCFETVMRACGEHREEGTWVTEEMVTAYTRLHKLGHAHSVEAWVRDPGAADQWVLAGGTYGVAVGALFAAESMFYRETDGSKVALAALVQHLIARGYELLDVQMVTEHTGRMGATEVPRRDYLRRLKKAVAKPGVTFA
jgi:leucyl/phenylalanyl-tRNA--protein transferase